MQLEPLSFRRFLLRRAAGDGRAWTEPKLGNPTWSSDGNDVTLAPISVSTI